MAFFNENPADVGGAQRRNALARLMQDPAAAPGYPGMYGAGHGMVPMHPTLPPMLAGSALTVAQPAYQPTMPAIGFGFGHPHHSGNALRRLTVFARR